MANELVYYPSNLFTEYSGGELYNAMYVGQRNTPFETTEDGACRFTNVLIPQGSVNYARLDIYASYVGIGTGGNLKIKMYGIDEDNTATFSSNPRSRPHTDAYALSTDINPSQGSYRSIECTNIVNEIANRGGWASGNAMGFLLDNNGSDNDHWIDDEDYQSRLIIRQSAEPNFLPTPKSISAPTFPTATNYGIKISKPGYEVLDAVDNQLLFTTRKKTIKVIAEGETTLVSSQKFIAHGLGYTPCVMGFIEAGGYRVKLNRNLDGATDPIGGGLQGYIAADDTYIKIYGGATSKVYYYVFIEEQSI